MDRAKTNRRMKKNFGTNSKNSKLLKRKTDMDWRHHGSFAVKVGLGLPLEGWVGFD